MRYVYGAAFRNTAPGPAWAARLNKKVGLAEFPGSGYALIV